MTLTAYFSQDVCHSTSKTPYGHVNKVCFSLEVVLKSPAAKDYELTDAIRAYHLNLHSTTDLEVTTKANLKIINVMS